jgi:ATPase subunit of ABC transporter with duplicated ATPase domains
VGAEDLLQYACRFFLKREMDLALIGLNNAGKSTLAEVLISGKFDQDLFTTVRAAFCSDIFCGSSCHPRVYLSQKREAYDSEVLKFASFGSI